MKKTLLKSIFVLSISIFIASCALLLNNYSGEHSDVNPGNEVEYVKPIKRGKHIRCYNKSDDLRIIMKKSDCTYIIEKDYAFDDTLVIPSKCELLFEGGSLRGPIRFNDTYLSGNINLKGSNLSGHISNYKFSTIWICYRDGMHDDAKNINNALQVCDSLYINSGKYLLIQPHEVNHKIPIDLSKSVDSYIGIFRSGISISAENDAVLIADNPRTVVCIYSEPGNISEQIKSISIDGVRIKCNNTGKDFNEFCHSIKLVGVTGCMISGCNFDDFWGDAICLSHYGDSPSTGERTRNIDISIKDNTIKGGRHHNNRNGISIISGQNVRVNSNSIHGTSRKDMPGAIDIEANNTAYTIEDIEINGNTISDCYGLTGGICLIANAAGGPAHNIRIINNKISSCPNGVGFGIYADGTVDNVFIAGNIVEADTEPYLFDGKGKTENWCFSNNVFKKKTKRVIGGKLTITNLKVD